MADRPDFGSRLRTAREARGLSLKEIAASTKISVLALEALERNDASRLPGGLFSRSFVRAYAKEVGLDPEQTVREFEQRVSGAGDSVEQEEPIRRRTTASESLSHGTVRWVGLVVTLALIAGWIGLDRYLGRQATAPARSSAATQSASGEALPPPPAAPRMPRAEIPKPPVEEPGAGATGAQAGGGSASPGPATAAAGQTAAAPTAGVSGVAAPSPSAVQGAVPPQVKAQPTPSPQGNPSAAPAATPPTGATAPAAVPTSAPDTSLPLQVVLAPRADCWVSVSVDGKRLPGRVLKAGEKVHLAAGQSIVLTAGDAGALDYTINNAPGRALGEAGQVKTVVINTTNYQGFIAR